MKILVLGASGGCGQWVVKLAYQRGHDVTALIRPTSSYSPPYGVTICQGELSDEGAIKRILPGHEAVISCLGMTLNKTGNPFMPLRSPPDLMSSTARRLCNAMPDCGIDRVVVISSGGVGDSLSDTHCLIRFLFRRSNIAIAHKDLALMEELYAKSTLDWMAIRPVTLKDGGPTHTAKPAAFYGLNSKITRGEVAKLMLDAVEQSERFTNHTPMLAG